jgi:hypothetical protein
VTVTVVKQITLVGVLVIVKLLVAELVDELVVKNAAAPDPSSFFALTLIVTPCDGMVEVMVTTSGKSVCGAGACVEFSGGVKVTTKLLSVGGGGGFVLLPQLPEIINAEITIL